VARGKRRDVREVIEDIIGAIESSPKKMKRVLLKTLLKECGFAAKTKERADMLMRMFQEAGITVNPDIREAGREDWIVLTRIEPPIPQTDYAAQLPVQELAGPEVDTWFDELAVRTFESEKEVEIRFILPLLERLGYTDEDRADGFPVEIYEGVKKATKEADFVLFDGPNRSKENALLIIEAKGPGRKLADYIGQARTYAIWLGTPYYLVTNADELRVFLYRSPYESDVEVFNSTRQNLKAGFRQLYNLISKQAVIEYKRQRTGSRALET